MKAVLCPVCDGDGQLKDAIFEGRETTKITMKLCHGCGGKGWIEVAEDKDVAISRIWDKESWDKCPTCGGDRNSPAGTGCPMGSHCRSAFSEAI